MTAVQWAQTTTSSNLRSQKDWEEISLGTIKWLGNTPIAGKDFVLNQVFLSWGMITTSDQETQTDDGHVARTKEYA